MADYKNQELLTDKKGRPIPQIWDPATGRFYPLTPDVHSNVTVKNFPEKQFVEDVSVKDELEQVKAELEAIKTKLNGTINTQLTGSHVGYSSEVKPAGRRGDAFLEIDTGNVYIHDGQRWVEL